LASFGGLMPVIIFYVLMLIFWSIVAAAINGLLMGVIFFLINRPLFNAIGIIFPQFLGVQLSFMQWFIIMFALTLLGKLSQTVVNKKD
jgi:hypothetical protein